ncbi:MAG: ABC transporter permease [Actinobacteria bacterium]|nr:ABC transporter permease [Actinomycetota bacterium]
MTNRFMRILGRPEFSAIAAALVIYIFFWSVAPSFRSLAAVGTVLYQAASVGLMAVSVSLLMIGGEFDLSAGVAVISSSVVASIVATELNAPLWLSLIVALLASLGLGFWNGWLVTRTGIPSFLITLSSLFMLFGMNLGVTRLVTNSVATPKVDQIAGYGILQKFFSGTWEVSSEAGAARFNIIILWWFVFVIIATYVLLRTRIGNWIFACGGNVNSARAVGVPVKKMKIGLFMFVGFSSWFYAMHQLASFNTIQAGTGYGAEFYYIIAAVVGGCSLTGGFGSAAGSAIGAMIYGMTMQGIVYAGWDQNWFRFFLGSMLLLAVLLTMNVKRLSAARSI